MYCKKCGKQVSDDAKFCKFCGTQFIKKGKVNGKVICKEIVEPKKVRNKNAILSIMGSLVAVIGCILPLSKFGIFAILLAIIAALVSLFFRIRGKDEMYQLYDTTGMLVGKQMLGISLTISGITLFLAVFTAIVFF